MTVLISVLVGYGSIARLPNILIIFEIYKTDRHSETVFLIQRENRRLSPLITATKWCMEQLGIKRCTQGYPT